MHLGRIQVGNLHRCISLKGDSIAAGRDADSVQILLLGVKVHYGIGIREIFSRCKCMCNIFPRHEEHCVRVFLARLLLPCAIPPKSFPNSVCQTSAVVGSFIIFLKLEMVSPVTGWTMGLA
jgi:hypothetical protein